ncbi:MAG: PKD domain-containing protein [Elusimicrobia bacterium]|nr:PKD domain-containing protein [Elusimicrobiota bacterium]
MKKMIKNNKKSLTLITLSFVFIFVFFPFKEAMAGTSQNVSGWAWSENIGWISFNGTNCDSDCNGGLCTSNGSAGCPAGQYNDYGVNIDATKDFSGYAWSENIGWIKFNPTGPYPRVSPNYSAKLDVTNKVTGWARACAGTENGDCTGATRSDGWDGWILLDGTEIDTVPSPQEFRKWAWGSDVVGWISFNHKNCDANGDGISDGIPVGCPPAGKSIPDYKVIFSSNAIAHSPTGLGVEDDSIEYCGASHINNPPVRLKWDSDSNQEGYLLRIYEGGSLVEESCTIGGCCGEPTCGGSSNAYVAQTLLYNKTYSWELKIWDNDDNGSVFVSGPPINTIRYSYPTPEFDWNPKTILAKDLITFTAYSTSTFHNPGNGTWEWDFGDSTPILGQNPVTHAYITPNPTGAGYKVKLTATANFDGKDHSCEVAHYTNVFFAPPSWIETPPPTK